MMRVIDISDEVCTKELAEKLASESIQGDCFALFGDLGCGKTTFVKYFIQYLTSNETQVQSPTFNIIKTYESEICEILHADLYRLETVEDVINIGILDELNDKIVLIEWPELIEGYLPKKSKKLHFKFNGKGREVEFLCANI